MKPEERALKDPPPELRKAMKERTDPFDDGPGPDGIREKKDRLD